MNAGNIITPIEFSVDDLRLLRIRSQLFIQLEPVNQVRLQLVNMAGKLIEESLVMKKGQGSKYTCLPENDQKEIQKDKMKALDILAKSIDDDVYINSVDDLKAIFSKSEVVQAFKDFSQIGSYKSLDYIFKNIKSKGDSLHNQKNLVDDEEAALIETKRQTAINEKINKDNLSISNNKILSEILSSGPNADFETVENLSDENFSTVVNLSEDGKTLKYSNSSLFDEICRATYEDSDDCIADSKARNFDSKLCKCFDVTSADFKPFDLKIAERSLKSNESDIEGKAVAQFLSPLTGEDALADLLTNDFTLNAASSDVSDLDLLLDEYKKDDIKPRTFVGPLTFVKNSNGGSLRPTDNLDEGHCVTDDCNTVDPIDRYGSIKNFAYERSKYHGSIAHFSGIQVDDFIKGGVLPNGDKIDSYADYKLKKKNREGFESLLFNFVKDMNLKYISLENNHLMEPTCIDINKTTGACLKKNNSHNLKQDKLLDDYINSLVYFDLLSKDAVEILSIKSNEENENNYNQYGHSFSTDSPTLDVLKNLVKMPYPKDSDNSKLGVVPVDYAKFNKTDYSNICGYLVYGLMGPKVKKSIKDYIKNDLNGRMDQKSRELLFKNDIGLKMRNLFQTCKNQAPYSIAIERKYKINKTGRYYYLGGKSLNINLGQSIGISHSSSVSKNFSVSPSDIIQGVPKALKLPGKDLYSAWSWSYGKAKSYSASAGTSINQGTFLVMQNAEFDVELTNYEQCVTARWSEPSINKFSDIFFGGYIDPDGRGRYDSQLSKDLRAGLMICSGEEETQPIAVRETYYYFTQHFVEGDMQDRNDIHNHPWLLQLRGLREYETFLASTHSDQIQADEDNEETVDAFELINAFDMMKSDLESIKRNEMSDAEYSKFERLKRHSWPLKQLIRTYRRISPTFPGLYTQLDQQAYAAEQWPWDSEPGKTLNEAEVKEQNRCEESQSRKAYSGPH